jgi:hypothetical protein
LFKHSGNDTTLEENEEREVFVSVNVGVKFKQEIQISNSQGQFSLEKFTE